MARVSGGHVWVDSRFVPVWESRSGKSGVYVGIFFSGFLCGGCVSGFCDFGGFVLTLGVYWGR